MAARHRRLPRALALACLLALVAATLPATAAAAPAIALSPATVTPGTVVTVSGSGFPSNRRGTLAVDGKNLLSITSARDGSVRASWTVLGSLASGPHQVTVTIGRQSATATLTMMQPAPLILGAFVDGAFGNPGLLDDFAAMTGHMPAIANVYQHWGYAPTRDFNAAFMDAAVERGATPMVTWEPWDPTQGTAQPAYALAVIARGDHDAYIRGWARAAAAWADPFYLRLAHEMNGTWYPWGAGVNGNTAADYVAAWRHVVDLFRAEGATNAIWVWAPNVVFSGSWPLVELFPGNDWVDWLGMDGYNWGTSQSWSSWQPLADVFGTTYAELTALTDKPLMISETASTELGGDKAAWIRYGLLADLPARFPEVRAVVWFHAKKETDWRVNSTRAALEAFREAATAPLYQAR